MRRPLRRPRRGRLRQLLLLTVLLPLFWGCAAKAPLREPPLLIHHGPPVTVEPVALLALSPQMEAFLDRYIRPYDNPDTRVQLLARAVGDSATLGFHYDDVRTFTASEAFEKRGGNCVSYANLIIALARGAGLDARYQEVIVAPSWTSRGDTVLVPRHINVIIETERMSYRLDTTGLEPRPNDIRRQLSDREAAGLYHSNLGAEALLASDLSRAYAQLIHAIELAPRRPDPWVNLGVVLGRNWQLDEAAAAYEQAIANDAGAVSAMANLHDVELKRGNEAAAAALAARVERYRRSNPFYLAFLAEEALEAHRAADAESLARKALDLRPDEARFYLVLAQAQHQAGQRQAAERSLLRARALAPADQQWNYARPLAERYSADEICPEVLLCNGDPVAVNVDMMAGLNVCAGKPECDVPLTLAALFRAHRVRP